MSAAVEQGLVQLSPLRPAPTPRGEVLRPEVASLRAYTHSLIGDAQNAVAELEMAWAALEVSAAKDWLRSAGERLDDVVRRVREVLR